MFLDTTTTANVPPFTPTNPQRRFSSQPLSRLHDWRIPRKVSIISRNEWSCAYAGINNWLFYAEGEWEEENGNVYEHEVVGRS